MTSSAETILSSGDVMVRECGALRRLTLNRPKALNALTLGMAETMIARLRGWARDPEVGAILIDGAGERGLCAGGDLRALYDGIKAGNSFPAQFWSAEYRLDVLIARSAKPVIAIMDGVVMGGGVGISAHAAHRVVTERSSVAMPEVAIGYFPDVAASFLLARALGQVGTHVALTGERMAAADAIYCGLADIHIPASRLADIPVALADCRSGEQIRSRLAEMASAPGAGPLANARPWIDRCYAADHVEEIMERLRASREEAAHAAHTTMMKVSPTALKLTLRNLRSALSFSTIEQSFQQDYRMSLACMAEHDLIEGIRATIVDKDRKPVWRPATLEEVTTELVDRHFRPVGELELSFGD